MNHLISYSCGFAKTRSFFLIFHALLVMFFTGVVHAEIYKWTDENGKVRFSDNSQHAESQGASIESVDVEDPYAVKSVEVAVPIPYSGDKPLRPVVLGDMTLEIPGSDGRNVAIGGVTSGVSCSKAKSLYWNEGYVDFADAVVRGSVINEFSWAGYQIADAKEELKPAGGSYELSAKVVRLRVNICFPDERKKKSKSNIYLKLRWELRNVTNDDVVFSIETEGSFDGLTARSDAVEKEVSDTFAKATGIAVRNLLAKQEFVDSLVSEDNAAQVARWKELMPLDVTFGDGGSSFKSQVELLKQTAVTVRTPEGHGSGVVLSNEGYILTNWHVVKNMEVVDVQIGGRVLQARVQRADSVKDVALLQVSLDATAQSAPVSRSKPVEGSEFFVIGTPLSQSLGHTITKGVFSANRKMNGQNYYQTDATINPGNSGGPVFNEQGELVGIAVAGLYTRDGGGVGINYAIPIGDALEALGIESGSGMTVKVRRAVASMQVDEAEFPRLHALLLWLRDYVGL